MKGHRQLVEPGSGEVVAQTAVCASDCEASLFHGNLLSQSCFTIAGTVLPSVILRKLAAAGRGNALSRALRALGRMEHTLFTLQWLSDPALRQRSHAGLNKGEATNSLRRAIFFHR